MTSTWLLLLIFSIWALLVVPLWIREMRSGTVSQVQTFRSAMETLREGQLVPAQKAGPVIHGKVSPRVGYVQAMKRKYLRQRRSAFLVTVATFPLSLYLSLAGLTPSTIWVLPPLATVTFVGFARYTISKVQKARQRQLAKPGAASAAPSRERSESRVTPRTSKEKRAVSSSLVGGLAAIRKAAARRLVATEPTLATQETQSWQPSGDLGSPWLAPEPVLPAYVEKAAAVVAQTEEVVEVVTPQPAWDGAAMVDAAKAQKSLETLAELIARLQAESAAKAAKPDDNTSEIPRILGA